MVYFIQFLHANGVFHIILQLYFASSGGKVSSVDIFFSLVKAQYIGQLFNIIEIIFQCVFFIIKQKNLLLALYSISSVESQDAFYCRAKKGINSPLRNCDSNIRILCLFHILANVQFKKINRCSKVLVIRNIL